MPPPPPVPPPPGFNVGALEGLPVGLSVIPLKGKTGLPVGAFEGLFVTLTGLPVGEFVGPFVGVGVATGGGLPLPSPEQNPS